MSAVAIKENYNINRWFSISVEYEGCPIFLNHEAIICLPFLMESLNIRYLLHEMTNKTHFKFKTISKV